MLSCPASRATQAKNLAEGDFTSLTEERFFQAPEFAVCKIEQMRMMNHAVEQGSSDFRVGENVVPAGKLQVGRDDDRLSFITL